MSDTCGVFERQRIGLPVDETGDPSSAFRISTGLRRQYLSLVHREISGLSSLHVAAPAISLVSVTGSHDDKAAIRVWAELTETTASTSFASVQLEVKDGAAGLTGLPTPSMPPTLRWDLIVPSWIPVSISSGHAAVDVFGMKGRVEVNAGHGRVAVLDCGPHVKVQADESGSIQWTGGSEGTIDLMADGQIKLCLATARFTGTIEAIARESVDVYIPSKFESAFRVEVCAADKLVCDDTTRAQLKKVSDSSRLAFESGEQATARFISLEGMLTIQRYGPD